MKITKKISSLLLPMHIGSKDGLSDPYLSTTPQLKVVVLCSSESNRLIGLMIKWSFRDEGKTK